MVRWKAVADDFVIIYILMLAALFIIGGGLLAFGTCGCSLIFIIPGIFIFWAVFKRSFWLKPPPEPKYSYYYPYTPYYPPLPPDDVPAYRLFSKRFFRKFNIPSVKTLLILFLVSIAIGAITLLTIETWFGIFAWAPFVFVFVIAFSFPSFIWISFVYHKDTFTPEPARNMMLILTWGMLSVIPAVIGEIILGAFWAVLGFSAAAVIILSATIDAPFVEEFCKPLGLRLVRFDVNTKLDGLIYGVTAGMGFAMIENMLYEFTVLAEPVMELGYDPGATGIAVAASSSWAFTSLVRGLGSTIGHAVGAGMIGMAFFSYRNSKDRPIMPIIGAYSLAVVLHMSWNGALSIMDSLGAHDAIIVTFIIGFPILELMILLHLLKIARSEEPEVVEPKRIREKFDIPEVQQHFPPPFYGPSVPPQYIPQPPPVYQQQNYQQPHYPTGFASAPYPYNYPYSYHYSRPPQQQTHPPSTGSGKKVRCPRCHKISKIPPPEYGNDMMCPFCGIIFRHPY